MNSRSMMARMTALNASQPNATPLYRQVKQILVQRIASGVWRPGELVPAEPKLGQELGVSPGTVRKALDELEAENLVIRQQGRGTFVTTHTPTSSLFHFFRLVDAKGQRVMPSGRELERRQGLASAAERQRLKLPPRAKVMRFRRVRWADGRGAMLESIAVPTEFFPDLRTYPGELPNTLYDLYQRSYGKTVRRVEEWLSASSVEDPETARHLDLEVGASVLEIDRIDYTFDDVPVEWRRSIVDTRALRYFIELV
jgi:GntR family transcriptional regulator